MFSKVVSPKVNVIARLGFEFAYSDVTIQLVCHYTTRTVVLSQTQKRVLEHVKKKPKKKNPKKPKKKQNTYRTPPPYSPRYDLNSIIAVL